MGHTTIQPPDAPPSAAGLLNDLRQTVLVGLSKSLRRAFAGVIDDPIRGFTPEDLATHVRTEFSTFSWLFEEMLNRCGVDVRDRHYRRGVYGAHTCARV